MTSQYLKIVQCILMEDVPFFSSPHDFTASMIYVRQVCHTSKVVEKHDLKNTTKQMKNLHP